MTNHTPTPWAYGALNLRYKYQVFHEHWNGDCQAVDFVCELDATGDVSKANAELIVRAVNSHQHLVEALKAIVAALTQPVQTSGLREPATCDILRGDATFAVNTARQALNQAKL